MPRRTGRGAGCGAAAAVADLLPRRRRGVPGAGAEVAYLRTRLGVESSAHSTRHTAPISARTAASTRQGLVDSRPVRLSRRWGVGTRVPRRRPHRRGTPAQHQPAGAAGEAGDPARARWPVGIGVSPPVPPGPPGPPPGDAAAPAVGRRGRCPPTPRCWVRAGRRRRLGVAAVGVAGTGRGAHGPGDRVGVERDLAVAGQHPALDRRPGLQADVGQGEHRSDERARRSDGGRAADLPEDVAGLGATDSATVLLLAVIRVEPAWKTKTASGSPSASSVTVPVRAIPLAAL